MADPDKFRSIRISKEVGEQIDAPARQLGWSANRFTEECVKACLAMINDPDERRVPLFVARLDVEDAERAPLKRPKGK